MTVHKDKKYGCLNNKESDSKRGFEGFGLKWVRLLFLLQNIWQMFYKSHAKKQQHQYKPKNIQ